MADVHPPEIRSKNMRAIRHKDTKPELIVRRALHASGFRYRLHVRNLPGSPDLVFPKYHSVIFVHGCFWHGHDCPLFKLPRTRTEFWTTKIGRNQSNDLSMKKALIAQHWKVAIVWECALKGREKDVRKVANRLADWLKGEEMELEIRG